MSQHKQIGSNIESSPLEKSRATPVRPAVWMTSVLVWATVIALFLHVPTWAGIFLCSLTGTSFLSFLIPYIYLMINDRDALRRERFHVKGSSAKQLGSVDTTNEKLIADAGGPIGIETQPLEKKQAMQVTGSERRRD